MMKKEVTIKFVNGVEASPIALLVQTANRFSSSNNCYHILIIHCQ